jgi:hypothetical protein
MWQWFNGKKVIIGTVLLYLSVYLIDGFLIGEINYSPEWLLVINKFCVYVGGLLIPTGLGHKAIKYIAANKQ